LTEKATETKHTPATTTGRTWWIRIGVLAGLVLLLIGSNALYFEAAAWNGTLSGVPGQVLYAAGFDAYGDEWQQYDGRDSATMQDGVLRLTVNTPNTIYSAAEPVFTDFDLRVTATATAGSIDNAYGVVFHLQEPETTCDMPALIFCDMAQIDLLEIPLRLAFRPQSSGATAYYMFLMSSDGYYSVWRGTNATSRRLSAWIPSDAIMQGLNAENRVRVVAVDDTFRFYINDTPLEVCIPDSPAGESTYAYGECIDGQMQAVLRDDSYSSGKIGMVVDTIQPGGGAGVTVEFDNLSVIYPQAILDEGNQT
jgi:hypothetical protein